MKYFDYVLATDGTEKTLVICPGFSRLGTGDLVRFDGSDGWQTILSSCTMSGDDDMQEFFAAAFGNAVIAEKIAKVSDADLGGEEDE